MAYIATGTYNDAEMSDADKALIAAYKQMWNNATTDAERAAAHAAAENVRSGYGYSGGTDGSNYVLLGNTNNTQNTNTGSDYSFNAADYDLSEYLKQQQAANTQASLDNLKSAYETSMRGYEQQGENLPTAYNEARNTLAAQKANAQRSFDERAAASGLNSGTAGQSTLARDNAYLSGVAGINEEQANARSELELEKANLVTNYQNAVAQAQNSGDAALAEALYNELIRVQNLQLESQQQANDERERAQELALKYGLADPTGLSSINSISDLANLGGTTSTSTVTTTSGGTGSGTGGSTIDNGGLTTAQIKEMQKYYGTTADGLWGKNSTAAAGGLGAQAAWAKYQASKNGDSYGINQNTGGGEVTHDYSSTLPNVTGRSYDPSKISYSPDEGTFTWNGKIYGNTEKLLNDIESANLNAYQKQQLQKAFAAYGIEVVFS